MSSSSLSNGSVSQQHQTITLTHAQYQQLTSLLHHADEIKQMLYACGLQPAIEVPKQTFEQMTQEVDDYLIKGEFVLAAKSWYRVCKSLEDAKVIATTKKNKLKQQFQTFCSYIAKDEVCEQIFQLLFQIRDIRWLLFLLAETPCFIKLFTIKSLTQANAAKFARDNLQLFRNMVKSNQKQPYNDAAVAIDMLNEFQHEIGIDRKNPKVKVTELTTTEAWKLLSTIVQKEQIIDYASYFGGVKDSLVFVNNYSKFQSQSQITQCCHSLPVYNLDFVYDIRLENCKNLTNVSLMFNDMVVRTWNVPENVSTFFLPLDNVDEEGCIDLVIEAESGKQLVVTSTIMMLCIPYVKVYLQMNKGGTSDMFCGVGVLSCELRAEIAKLSGKMKLCGKDIWFRNGGIFKIIN